MKKSLAILSIILSLCLFFAGCDSENIFTNPGDKLGGGEVGDIPSSSSSTHDTIIADNDYSLDQVSENIDSQGVDTLTGNTITCTNDISYVLTGDYLEGITISAKKGNTIHLFLNNATISSNTTSAIVKTDKQINLILTCVNGTSNVISNSVDSANAIQVKGSLTINGSGSLTVNATGNDASAIKVSKAFNIADASLTVSSTKHGITAEEIIAQDATIDVLSALKDGLHTECDFDNENGTEYKFSVDTGYVYLSNVNYNCSVNGDGIQADTFICVDGGEYNITTNGEFVANTTANRTAYGLVNDDFKYIKQNNKYVRIASDTRTTSTKYALSQSAKGIKVGTIEYDTNGDDVDDKAVTNGDYFIQIKGGNIIINSTDDSIHTNIGNVYIDGGAITVDTTDDAITCDNLLLFSDGNLTVNSCYEGLEGCFVEIVGGDIDITSSDDGINATSETSKDIHIIISGGKVVINASGDGIDSNGSLLISGGEVYVFGPTTGADAGLDSEKGIVITGGKVFASSTLGMVETPSTNSTSKVLSFAQNTTLLQGTVISILDSDSNVLMEVTLVKNCQSLIISMANFTQGKTYSIYGGNTLLSTFTITSTVTTIGSSNNINRPGDRPGGNIGGGTFNPNNRPM